VYDRLNVRQRFPTFIATVVVVYTLMEIYPLGLGGLITVVCLDELLRNAVDTSLIFRSTHAIASFVICWISYHFGHMGLNFSLFIFTMVLCFSQVWKASHDPSLLSLSGFSHFSLTIFAHAYITFPMAHCFILLSLFQESVRPILFVIFVVAGGENGALLCGVLSGKHAHPVFPTISPKKSLQGLIGQMITSPLLSLILPHYFDTRLKFSSVEYFIIGIILGAVGIFGDFFESFIKRSLQKKDMSALMPGVGGFLDRMDGLLFSFPVLYYVCLWKKILDAKQGST